MMIEATNLTKRFGGIAAVDNITFGVEAGQVVGLLGPNGAGKTTTMRILAGYLSATDGTVLVGGRDIRKESLEHRKHIGYLPETVPLYSEMRVHEYLWYRASLKGLGGRRRRMRIETVIRDCGLSDVRTRMIGQLSKGYRQRIGLADSLVHEPDLLILDEPTIGLDPNQNRLIRNLIRGLGHRHTVLLSSHILSEVERICDHVIVINRGNIVTSGRRRDLLRALKSRVRVDVRGDRKRVAAVLSEIQNIRHVVPGHDHGTWHSFTCDVAAGSDVREAVFQAVVRNGWAIRELSADEPSLEDLFVDVTEGGLKRAELPGSVEAGV